MSQEFLLDWIVGHLTKHEANVVAAALRRMSLRDAPAEWNGLRWELLDWFVKYAEANLEQGSESRLSELDEEIQVLQILGSFNLAPWVPNKQEMMELQGHVRTVLHDLEEKNIARIGPIAIEFITYRGTDRAHRIPEAVKAKGVMMLGSVPVPVGRLPAEGVTFQVPPVGKDAVLHCLAQLLTKFPGAVRRCRACGKLFARLKSRSNPGDGSSCSRQCQTRSWAKDQYARKKAELERRKTDGDGKGSKNRTRKKGTDATKKRQ